jgi:hypothetical protein
MAQHSTQQREADAAPPQPGPVARRRKHRGRIGVIYSQQAVPGTLPEYHLKVIKGLKTAMPSESQAKAVDRYVQPLMSKSHV